MKNSSEPTRRRRLELPVLESCLWKAACGIRGPVDVPKFKDCILSLIFLKRLSDVVDDEARHFAGDGKLVVEEKRRMALETLLQSLLHYLVTGKLQEFSIPGPGRIVVLDDQNLRHERLSTSAVTRMLIDADTRRDKRAEVVDKLAASYILQGFLDRLRISP